MPNEIIIGDPDPKVWIQMLKEGKMRPEEFVKLMKEYTAAILRTGIE